MWAGILSVLMKFLGVFDKFLSRRFSEENVLKEKSKREIEIQDEAEVAARLAASEKENEKLEGIDRMRKLVSD